MAVNPPVRIPLAFAYNARTPDATIKGQDVRRVNVMDEPKPDSQDMYVLKRVNVTPVLVNWGSSTGQGMVEYNGTLCAVTSDVFHTLFPPNSGASGTQWVQSSAGPWTQRIAPQAVVKDNLIYLMGGFTTGVGYLSDVWTTPDGINWSQVTGAAPWGGRDDHCCAVFNGQIYLAAGNAGAVAINNDVWSSPDGQMWTQLTASAAWPARNTARMVATNSGLFLMGGFAQGSFFNDIWFSADGASWTQIKPAGAYWSARAGFALFNFDNALWVVGGYNATLSLTDCWKSTDGAQTWVQTSTGQFGANGLSRMGYTVYNRKMWLINGLGAISSAQNTVYNSSDGITWTLVTNSGPIAAEWDCAAVTFTTPTSVSPGHYQTMYCMGGNSGGLTYSNWRAVLDTQLATNTPLFPPVTLQQYQFESFVEGSVLLVKNESAMWVYEGGNLNRVKDYGYPIETVYGIVVMGGFAYVMDPTGLIHASAANDPYHWPATNVIGADYSDDAGFAIAKYKNYLVAFGKYTTQFFYDAGRNPGSPLLPYSNANIKVGLWGASQGAPYCFVGDWLVYVSRIKGGMPQVMILKDSLTPIPISDQWVDQVLYTFGLRNIFYFPWQKHMFVVVVPDGGMPSMVFDFLTKRWIGEWWTQGRNNFDWAGSCHGTDVFPGSNTTYFLDTTTGQIWQTLALNGAENGGFVQTFIQSPKIDGNNNRRKFWGRLDLIGDRNAGRPTIEFSDDDYQTWSTPRAVDMADGRPAMFRNGASFRRAYRITQNDGNPIRWEALEQVIEQGN